MPSPHSCAASWRRSRGRGPVARGAYGLSIESGEPIPAERLEAIPWAERTAAEEERLR